MAGADLKTRSGWSMTNRRGPAALCLVAWGAVWLFIAPGVSAQAQPAEDSLARSIVDLKSDEFQLRQRATKELEIAGPAAVPLLAEAVKSSDKEVRARAIGILLAQASSKEPQRRDTARAALVELSSSANRTVSQAAWAALISARDGGAAVAAAELTRLGAMVEKASVPGDNTGPPHYNVMIRQAWTGGDKGLALISELGNVPFLTMENAPLHDNCLVHVAKLTGLTRLYIGSTKITGSGLAMLAPLVKLQQLSLRELPIDDAKLARLPSFENLRYLGLDGTQVTDRGLKELARFPQLQMLWLNQTRVSDAGLVHLKALPELYTLFLAGTKVSGPGLAELRNLPRLNYLSLKGNKLDQGSVRLLGQLEQLETLGLDETNVTDDQLAALTGLTRLRRLYLTKTDITDAGLEYLKDLPQLETVYVGETQVSAEGIDKLRKVRPSYDVRR